MTKNAVRGYIILAVALVVFSVVSFVIPFAHTQVFWVGFAFGVLAILAQLYIFRIAHTADGDARSRFYGFPVARVGICYLVIQLIASFIEMALAKVLPSWVPWIVNVIILVIAVVGCVTVDAMRDEIVRQDGQLKKNISNMRELQSLSAALVGQCSDEGLKPTLVKLADEFRYSDPISSGKTREMEDDMRNQLGNIQQALVDGDTDGAKNLCAKLTACLAERNRVCSVNK